MSDQTIIVADLGRRPVAEPPETPVEPLYDPEQIYGVLSQRLTGSDGPCLSVRFEIVSLSTPDRILHSGDQ